MEETQLYAIFWKCCAAVISIVALSVASCTVHQNYVQTQVIAKSANPAAVACSFQGQSEQNTPFCVEAAKHGD